MTPSYSAPLSLEKAQDQVPHTSCTQGLGTRCGGLLQDRVDGRRHGERRKPLPGSTPSAGAATAPACSADVQERSPLAEGPAPALRGEMAAPRRRPAGGAAGRSLREGG